jgi:threonylcarbamoyladenosine tRNA methylthiotransferase MtaB
MRGDLVRAGWTAVDEGVEADVVVVNTCTVTRRADQEARQLVHRIARERPGARIVVAGCYAQRAPEEVRSLPGVGEVLGMAERGTIAERLRTYAGPGTGQARGAASDASPVVWVSPARAQGGASRGDMAVAQPRFTGRARALLKVQDGCDSFCGYCIVPYVRGRSASVAPEKAVEQARRLLEAGFHEIVLTGADLGSYGRRLAGPAGGPGALARLVEAILTLGSAHRVRLSSIEPHKVDTALLDLLATEPRLCRHLHLPLQSGSDEILHAMRRGYRARDYARLVERAASAGPIGIGADVIVGHPGEGDAELEETARLVSELPISFLHVFRYSPRPGTRASHLPEGSAAGAREVRERAERLRAIGAAKRAAFLRSLVGTVRQAIPEERRGPGGERVGTTDLYPSVLLPREPLPRERGAIPVRIASSDGEFLRASID